MRENLKIIHYLSIYAIEFISLSLIANNWNNSIEHSIDSLQIQKENEILQMNKEWNENLMCKLTDHSYSPQFIPSSKFEPHV